MIAKKLLTTIAFAFVLLFSGCAEDDFDGVDGLCPLVVSTVPEDGDVDVPLNQVITATFNEKMNPATITKTSFTVSLNGVNIDGTVSYNGLTATFIPSSLLEPDTEYTGTITTMAKDERGNALQENYVWTFTTLPEYLVVVSSNPLIGGITTGGGEFLKGTSVTVNAVPNAGYTFTNWTSGGVQVSTSPNYTFVLMGDRTLVANYTIIPPTQFALNTSALPVAGGSTTGSGSFDQGTLVTVTATANTGYNFVNWTLAGVQVSVNPNYSFALNANTNLVANFVLKTYNIVLSSNPPLGGNTTGEGSFNYGSTRTVTATANANYAFSNWTENGVIVPGAGANYEFVLTGNRTLVANFTSIQYNIALSANPAIGGTTNGAGSFSSGSTRTVTATPNALYTFSNWTENGVIVPGAGASYQFVLTGNRTLVANFTAVVPTQLSVTLSANPNEGGVTDGAGLFDAGSTVQVTATPNSGFTFSNWTENNVIVPNAGPNYQFVITTNRNLVANFAAIPVTGGICPNPAVDLGLAGDYAILAKSGVSTTEVTSVVGNIGVSPIGSTGITGFGLIMDPSGTFATSSLVTGRVYAADYTSPTPSNLSTAVSNLETAFTTANGMAPDFTNLHSGNLNGQTLVSGVYKYTTGVLITNEITLDGGGNDCAPFVFQIDGSLTVSPDTKIILINGAKADNIYWVVAGTGAMINTDVDFSGNILTYALISVNSRSTVKGRLLAQSAVSLIGNTVVKPSN